MGDEGRSSRLLLAPPSDELGQALHNALSSSMEVLESGPLERRAAVTRPFLSSQWRIFLSEGTLADTFLRTDDGVTFGVHRVVLMAASPFFRRLYRVKRENNAVSDASGANKGDAGVVSEVRPLRLTVHDTPSHVLKVLLSFAYTGNDGGALTPSIAASILPLGTKWGMTNAVTECATYLVDSMTADNCLRIYAQGLPYFCPTLATRAKRYVLRHFKDVVRSEDFLSLDARGVSDILGDDHLNARNEAAVFEAIRAWVERDPEGRVSALKQLLTCVRFGLMSYGYFTNVVFQWNLVDEEIRRSLYGPSMFLAQIDSLNNAEVDLSDPLARPRIPHEVVFCVGGWSAGSPTAFMETYDVRADRWFLSAHPDTTPRAYHGLVALGTHLYVVGGFDGNEHFSTVRRYDPVNKVWDERACMLFARCYVSCAALGGEIYACGGYNGRVRMASVERYTPATNLWELVTPMNRQRSDASAAALGGRVYVAGGFTGTEVLNSVEAYDPSSAQWTFVRPMNTARSGVSLVAYREALYALGGFNGFSRLNTAERYEPDESSGSLQWTMVPEMSSARSNFAAVCADDLLIVIGGFNGATTIPYVECYDAKGGEWFDASHMNLNRSAVAAAVVADLPNSAEYAYAHKVEELLGRAQTTT